MDTLVDLLRDAAARYGNRPAVSAHVGLRDRSWSYRQLWDASGAIAGYLRTDLGLTPGTALGVWAPNSPHLVATLFGAMRARLTVVPIDPTATVEFVAKVVAATRAPVLVCGARAPGLEYGGRIVAIDDLPLEAGEAAFGDAPLASDVAEVVFTSGTTGAPKGVVLTHRNIVTNVQSALALVPTRPLRLVSILPLSHMMEQTVGLYGPLVLGSSIHYPASRRASVLRKAMQRNAANALVLVPQALELMLDGIEREVRRRGASTAWDRAHRLAGHLPMCLRRRLFREVLAALGGRLRFVICGGAHLRAELAATWERMGVRVMEGYGATECSPIVAANSYWERAPGTVGHPIRGVEVSLSNDDEILVAGPSVSQGYWEDPTATGRAFDTTGRYRTGDLGAWDDRGRLRITGRLTDRIVLPSGLNVYPIDIEDELRKEPEIADCVVVPRRGPDGEPRLHAVIIPTAPEPDPITSHNDAVEAVKRAGARLAPHQHVTGCTVWTAGDFPRTNLNKVKRYEVMEALAAASDARIVDTDRAPRLEEDSTLRRVCAAVAHLRSLDPTAINPESDLTVDLGLDSLCRVELAMVLEEEFGVDIEDGDIAAVESVAELCGLIERGDETPAPAVGTWPRRWWVQILRDVVQHLVLFPLHALVARPFVVTGRDHLGDVEGPVLIVSNHSSHLDTPSILRALPHRLRVKTAVAAAADYFYSSRWRSSLATLALGTFPFSREGMVRASLERCGELVDGGSTIVIYPEGTRSITGTMAPFRSGIGLLAEQLGVPVVPVGIAGTHALWPKGAKQPRRGPVHVHIGNPMDIPPDADRDELMILLEQSVSSLVKMGESPRLS